MRFGLKAGLHLCMMLSVMTVFAQDTVTTAAAPVAPAVKNVEAGFDGMLGLSYGTDTMALNVGGPSLKYKFNKNFKVGIGAFPSLIHMDDKVQPRLAFSPIVEYKRWMLITPYYGYNSEDKMIWTFGVGYKFI